MGGLGQLTEAREGVAGRNSASCPLLALEREEPSHQESPHVIANKRKGAVASSRASPPPAERGAKEAKEAKEAAGEGRRAVEMGGCGRAKKALAIALPALPIQRRG